MHTRDCVYQMKSAHIRTEVVTDGDSLLEFVFVIEDMRERERCTTYFSLSDSRCETL